MPQRLKTDWILFATVLVMAFFGLVMVYSASSVMAELKYHSAYHVALQQAASLLVALSMMMALKRMHYRKLQNPAVAFGAVAGALILLLAVYFLDARHHRWVRVKGFSLQPSELAKPALIIFLAFFVTLRSKALNDRRHTLFPALLTVGLLTLSVMLADLGTAIVLAATAAVVFFVAGLEGRYCAFALALVAVGGAVAVVSKPYRLARLLSYFDPEFRIVSRFDTGHKLKDYLHTSMVARDTRYQAEQSIIAVGAGGPAGLGLMQSKQKLFYLPEAHTDFIFAVIAEELGILGSLAVLAGFLIILWRGMRAVLWSGDDFGRYLALGVTTMIVFQGLLNMSVVLDLMPTKGIPLPLISAGGSSLLSTLSSLGILMNVAEHAG